MLAGRICGPNACHEITINSDIVLTVNPTKVCPLAICTRQRCLTNDLLKDWDSTIYAPDTFKCSASLSPENQRKVVWVPYSAQVKHELPHNKSLLLEPHAIDKTLLRCVWLLKVRHPPKWNSLPVINYIGSPEALVVKEKSFIVGVEGRPDREFGDLLRKRLEGFAPPTLLVPSDHVFESSTVRARVLISQSHEGILETIRVFVPRMGRIIVTADEPLRTLLDFCDVLLWQLARLPSNCQTSLLVYGQNIRNIFALLDSHFYFQLIQSTDNQVSSEASRYRQSLYERLTTGQIEILSNAAEVYKRLLKGGVLLWLLCTPEEFFEALEGDVDTEEVPDIQLWAADPSEMDWKLKTVAKGFLAEHADAGGSSVLVRLRRSQTGPSSPEKCHTVELPLPAPLAWEDWQGPEAAVKEVSVPISGQVLMPLTTGSPPELFVSRLCDKDEVLKLPQRCLVMGEIKHDYIFMPNKDHKDLLP